MASRQLRVFIVGDAESAARAASKVEKRFGTMGSKLGKIGQKIAGAFRGAALGAAAAVTGVLAKAVTSGWSRLQALERSEKMFHQMGLSADETRSAMDRLNDTVTGTAFSLDEGASAMTNLISAGASLDSVGRQMDMIADAAAFGQVPLNEIAEIFQKIEINGKASRRELNQLSHRNIPIFSMMSDSLGKTGEEFDKFVSRGGLTSEVFLDAWETAAKGFGEQGIVIEGAAKSMGDTVPGALGNTGTALARFGAVLVGPVYRSMPKILSVTTGAINDLTLAAGPFIDSLGDRMRKIDFGRVVKVFKGAIPILENFGSILGDVARVAGQVVPIAFGALVAGIDVAFKVLRPVSDALASISSFLADHSTLILTVAGAWVAWKGITRIISAVDAGVDRLAIGLYNLAGTVGDSSFGQVIGGLVDMSKALVNPEVAQSGKLMGESWHAGAARAKEGLSGVGTALSKIAGPVGLAAIAGFASAWKSAGDKASAAMDQMKDAADDSLDGIGSIVEGAREMGREAESNLSSNSPWGLAWDSAGAAVQGLGSMFGLMEPKIAENNRLIEKSGSAAREAAERYTDLQQAYAGVAAEWEGFKLGDDVSLDPNLFKDGIESAEKWARAVGLSADEVMRLSEEGDLTRVLTDARDAAVNGTPAMDAMADAVADLADETANSTERLDAWRKMVDAAMGGQKNLMDSTISFKDSLKSMEQSVKDSGLAFDVNSEAGRKNLSALSSLVDKAVDHAGAVGEETGSVDEASEALRKNRKHIIDQLEASGMARDEAGKLVDSFGLSRDAINEVAAAATNARDGIDSIPNEKTIRITTYWDEIKRNLTPEQGDAYREGYAKKYGKKHSGGIFRASRPGGEGLALLRDGERVMTPDQQGPPPPRAGVEAHHTTIVNLHVEGSVLTDEDLLTFVGDGLERREDRTPHKKRRF